MLRSEKQVESDSFPRPSSVDTGPVPAPIPQSVPDQRSRLSLGQRRKLIAFMYPLLVKGKAAVCARILLSQQQLHPTGATSPGLRALSSS